jgi:hypothetical protein
MFAGIDQDSIKGKVSYKKNGQEQKPDMKPPTEKPTDKKDLRAEMTRMITEMIPDEALRPDYIADKSGFEGKNNAGEKQWVEGKRSVDEISEKAVPVIYGRVKKDYEAFQNQKG